MEEPSQKNGVINLDSQEYLELYKRLCELDKQLIEAKGRENACIMFGRIGGDDALTSVKQVIAEISEKIRRIEKKLAEKYGYGVTISVADSKRRLPYKEYLDRVVISVSEDDIELYKELCGLDVECIRLIHKESDCREKGEEVISGIRQEIAENSKKTRELERKLAEKYGYGVMISDSDSERSLPMKESYDLEEF
jgi:hypothetical protein